MVISIVGARRCTKYGEDIAYRLAYALAEQGVVIISGMAYGIDTAAHRGCLDAGGTTVAVLGTPIDKIYPQSNRRLAERILQNGAILSEYSPETETRAWHFCTGIGLLSGYLTLLLSLKRASVLVLSARHNAP